MNSLWVFYQNNAEKLFAQLLEHLQLTVVSVLLACIISIPLGILIARNKKLSSTVLNFTGILQTIPSIALLGFLIPFLGIGTKPAIFALFLYSLLPILRNVYTGITGIDEAVKESALGLGLNPWQRLFKVELPLALPTIMAGIRTATVINVGVATLAAYIAAGGLGEFIFGGIALNNSTMILAGAIPAALLAIFLDLLLSLLQKHASKLSSWAMIAVIPVFLMLAFVNGSSKTALHAGFPPEFVGRDDGLPALRKTYDLQISNVVIAPALMYQAVADGLVDVISGYSTDGRIKSYELRVLEDDAKAFPPYQAGLLYRKALQQEFPNLDSVINLLSGTISDTEMQGMNYQVDEEKRDVHSVARAFLKARGLLHPAKAEAKKEIIIASKIFTEQYLLTEIYKLLLEGHLPLKVKTKKGLGGTKICFDALLANEIHMYPEYSGTALQVLLKENYNDKLSPEEVYAEVKEKLVKQHLLFSQPLGFNNTYALMVRQSLADSLNIKSISQLRAFVN